MFLRILENMLWRVSIKSPYIRFHHFDKINFHLVGLNGKFYMNVVYLT